ncbi:MAG TPA: DUF4384 domain-containing protein [Pyrinomonadaceae bacterium]|jgi:hypothetical protein
MMKARNDSRAFAGRVFDSALRPSRWRVLCLCVFTFCLAGVGAARQGARDDETSRALWDTAFGAGVRRPTSGKRGARRGYKILTPRVSREGVKADSVVGVTVWRLRPSGAAVEGERLLTHEGADTVAWIPERVPSDAALSEGDRVRLSIEAARTGYLYVIDRELYADGTKGEPYLIFPTTRTLGGNNRVEAGRLVDIPGQDDSVPYFTLRRSRADHVGESLHVVITKEPLEGLEVGAQAQRLPEARVASWEKSWGEGVGRLELAGGAGRPWTKEEREAGADGRRKLKPGAPAPQTLYYRPDAESDRPLLIQVQLRYGRAAARRSRR